MKNQWIRKISIVVAVLLLLAVLPMSAMAEKETKTKSGGSGAKATSSNASAQTATASDAYEDGELLDGQVHDDIPAGEDEETEETSVTDGIKPAETAAVPEPKPAEKPEKQDAGNITGTWTVDEITTYRFDDNGSGELLLPEHTYSFSYTAENDELTLDFDSDSIQTAVFTYTVEEDKLLLKRGSEAGTSEYTLVRD